MTGIRSAARRAIGPTPISARTPSGGSGNEPVAGTMLLELLWPNTPLKNAGRRIEPPMSVDSENGAKPAPIAAPSPPLEPPAIRVGSYALAVRPYTRLSASIHIVSSDVFVTPIGIAPAARSRA